MGYIKWSEQPGTPEEEYTADASASTTFAESIVLFRDVLDSPGACLSLIIDASEMPFSFAVTNLRAWTCEFERCKGWENIKAFDIVITSQLLQTILNSTMPTDARIHFHTDVQEACEARGVDYELVL